MHEGGTLSRAGVHVDALAPGVRARAAIARHGSIGRDRAAPLSGSCRWRYSDGAAPPPICFATGDVARQRPGDAVVFHGAATHHWRDVLVGDNFGQIFMNFVRDVPYRDSRSTGAHRACPAALVPHEVRRLS